MEDNDWHLTRAVPITIILGLILQTSAVVWWGSDITARLRAVERGLDRAEPVTERLTRQEERTVSIQESLSTMNSRQVRIETKLDEVLSDRPK